MNVKNKCEYLVTRFCLIIIFIFMATFFLRAGCRLYIKITGKPNKFTNIVFFDNKTLAENNDSNVIESINWQELYPFEVRNFISEEKNCFFERLKKKIRIPFEKINSWISENIIYKTELAKFCKSVENNLKWNMNDIVRMKNGHLNEYLPKKNISEVSASIQEFSNFCKERKMRFLYVQAPYKTCKFDEDVSGKVDFSNQNADSLLQSLKENRICVLDLRNELHKSGYNHYDSFFITDHHWKPETGLWGAEKIAEFLKDTYKIDVDLSIFSKDKYTHTIIKDIFLGSRGLEVPKNAANPENITLIRPKDKCNLSYKRYNSSSLIQTEDGDFDILLDKVPIKNECNYEINAYGSYMHGDNVSFVTNNNSKNNTKILLIGDSFTDVIEPFLALCINQLDCIDPRVFSGSFESYIDKHDFYDCVILLYNPSMIQDNVNPDSHQDPFDFN